MKKQSILKKTLSSFKNASVPKWERRKYAVVADRLVTDSNIEKR